MEISKKKIKIGPYEICPVNTGIFGLDGGAMFGTVPKVLWSKTNPPDDKNRIEMEARALLLKSPGLNILIDAGNGGDYVAKYGDKLGPKFKEMFNIQSSENVLLQSLKNHGLTPDDIHVVILTHLHFDHCGGGVIEKNGKLVPAFPNAKYYVQKQNLENAQKPNLRERASYYASNFQPLLDHGVLNLIDGEKENLLPGISVRLSHGHTVGQQMVIVKGPEGGLVYCGDVIPTSTHIRIPWMMGYDLNPLLIMEEKEKILKEAVAGDWYLFFEHDPYCHAATVAVNGTDFQAKEKFLLE